MVDYSIWLEWVLIYTLVFPTDVGFGIERYEIKEHIASSESECKRAKMMLQQIYPKNRIPKLEGERCIERLKINE